MRNSNSSNSILLSKFKSFYDKIKPFLEGGALIMAICGFTLITITSSLWTHLPWVQPDSFEEKVFSLRLSQNNDFIVDSFGNPQIKKSFSYKTIDGKTEEGVKSIYYHADYMLINYFDKDSNLFGYVVFSENKYFKPKVPYTRQSQEKSKLQVLNKFSFNDINIIDPYDPDNKPYLFALSFFARSGTEYIEQYYTEVYDLGVLGYLGFATTDFLSQKYADRNKYFKFLSDISYNNKDSLFYKKYESSIKNNVFFTLNENNSFEAKQILNTDGNIGNMRPNSYFLFSQQSNIDMVDFLSSVLNKNYFEDKMFILQQ